MALVLTGVITPTLRGADWKPITPEEMALKDDPLNRGASAVILYREVYTDDEHWSDREYVRIKILRDEGKKYADIEIPFRKDLMNVLDIDARTVQPDGQIVEFKGKVFEKPYAKSRRTDIVAKAFTLPGVAAGSIVEFRFRVVRDKNWLFHSRWLLQGEISTLQANYRLLPYKDRTIAWVNFGLPPGRQVTMRDDGIVELNIQNMAAVPDEEFSPPEDILKARVLFYYMSQKLSGSDMNNPENFWKPTGQDYFKEDNSFIGKRKEIISLANQLVSPSDPPESKLRKLYARAQQIRNLDYERERSEKELEKEKLKENMDAGAVLKHGFGDSGDINRFFAGLARAAGFEATVVYLAARNEGMFERLVLSTRI